MPASSVSVRESRVMSEHSRPRAARDHQAVSRRARQRPRRFRPAEGEIHALLGENGAGKSTLMNILYGLYQPDEGEILLDGQPSSFATANDAIAAGIGMVHQHFMLIPPLTVAENIMLGEEPPYGGVLLDFGEAPEQRARAVRAVRPAVDPDAPVEDLPVGAQQRVEILKALYRDAEILILDEPTAVLTPQEVDELFAILARCRRRGSRSSSSPTSCTRSWRSPIGSPSCGAARRRDRADGARPRRASRG